jgi:hypothetical protein
MKLDSLSKIIAIIFMSLLFFSQSATADCRPDRICQDDVISQQDKETKSIAPILTIGALTGIGIWYILSDKSDKNIHNLKFNNQPKKNRRYKFSLAPIATKGKQIGALLQISYMF